MKKLFLLSVCFLFLNGSSFAGKVPHSVFTKDEKLMLLDKSILCAESIGILEKYLNGNEETQKKYQKDIDYIYVRLCTFLDVPWIYAQIGPALSKIIVSCTLKIDYIRYQKPHIKKRTKKLEEEKAR